MQKKLRNMLGRRNTADVASNIQPFPSYCRCTMKDIRIELVTFDYASLLYNDSSVEVIWNANKFSLVKVCILNKTFHKLCLLIWNQSR